jgi:hypothetical protein
MRGDLLFRWAGQAYVVGLGLAILLLLAEGWWPRARQRTELGRRWLANLSAFGITLIVFRWLPQLSLLGAAMLAERNGWGLLNQLHVPDLVAVTLGWLAVDLSGYLVHRAEHRFPLLWRVHRLHHSDPDVDVTTTYRFHPFEVLLRAGVQVIVAIAMGMPPAAAVGYLLLTAAISVFSHANLRLPHALDRAIGMVKRMRSIEPSAWSSSRPASIARTTPSIRPNRTRTSASACPAGIGCSAHSDPRHCWDTTRSSLASRDGRRTTQRRSRECWRIRSCLNDPP